MKKHFFCLALALVMCLGLMPGTAGALGVRVAGTELEDGYYSLSDGKVVAGTAESHHIHFEKDSGTLTLRDAAIAADTGESVILFTYEANNEKAVLNLIGQNTISGSSFAINAMDATGNIPSSSADVEAQLTINGQNGGGLTTSGTRWGIQAPNLTIDSVNLEMTTAGHSALRIGRDLVIQNSEITTKDSGDGGDFYVDRFIRFSDSIIDMSGINVEYPSIYLDNTHCPAELKVSPAVVIEDSDLKIGGQKNSNLGFILYVVDGGADIKNSTLAAINDRIGIAVAGGTLNIAGASKIDSGSNLAVRALEKAVVGADAVVQGASADGKPLVNNGMISLPDGITAEQLNEPGGALHYYGGGTIKVGDNDVYHSLRIAPRNGTPLDEVEVQWILNGSTDIPLEAPEKEGYTFMGWYTNEECTAAYDPSIPITQSFLLYAKWDEASYKMCFDSQGGTPVADQTITKNGTALRPATPTRSGYTFGGWYTDADCTTAYDFSAPVTENLTLYAKWTQNSSGSSGGGFSGGSGGSSSTTTTQNPDDSTTTTTTDKKTGTVSETTRAPDGTSITVVTDKAGNVTTEASVPRGTGSATLPVPVEKDTEVEITVKGGGTAQVEIPTAGAAPGTVAVIVAPDGSETVVRKSIPTEGGVVVMVKGSAVVKLVDTGRTFSDVPRTHWAVDAAAFVSARELFSGTGPNAFSPDQPMSRAMLAVVLHNLEDNPASRFTSSFDDVADSSWYASGVAWAAERGIISGYGGGRFGPNDPITREQLAAMLWQYAGRPEFSELALPFQDTDQVSPWAADALRWAVDRGILSGRGGGVLDPTGYATRAEAAQMLKVFLEQQV